MLNVEFRRWLSAGILVCTLVLSPNAGGAGTIEDVLGYDVMVETESTPNVQGHVRGSTGSIHSRLHVSPKVLSWMAIIGGGALVVSGLASDSGRYQKGATITGGILIPLGIYDAFLREAAAPLVSDSTVRDYEAVVRSMFASGRDEDRVRELMRLHPSLHKRLLFTMGALRDQDWETPKDTAFIEWYLAISGQ